MSERHVRPGMVYTIKPINLEKCITPGKSSRGFLFGHNVERIPMEERGKISFVAAVLMNINIIVGSGIYFAPQLMAQQTGGTSFLGWILAGFL